MLAYLNHVAILITIYIVLAQSYNLIMGFGGMLHVGHIAFFGIGAYTASLLTLAGYSFWTGVIAAAILTAAAGALLGIPTLKFKEDYLTIATLGFGEIVRIVMLNWMDVTQGPLGLRGMPRPSLFGITFQENYLFLIFSGTLALLSCLIMYRIVHSPYGKTLEATREDEIATKALGKNTWFIKLQALIVGALFAGIAGAISAHYLQFIEPNSFSLREMVFILLVVILGGSGNFWGTIVGTLVLFGIFEPLRFIPNIIPDPEWRIKISHIIGPLRQSIYAILFILIMIFRPYGIFGRKVKKSRL